MTDPDGVELAPGLTYHQERYFADEFYWVRIDLSQRTVTTETNGPRFPIPLVPAIGHGLAGVGADFRCNGGQPCHLYVIDREIWTTGLAVGFSYLQAPGKALIARNAWSVDVNDTPVARINAGTGEGVSAFTHRGGSLERPPEIGHKRLLVNPTKWVEHPMSWSRSYDVEHYPGGEVLPHTIVLNSDEAFDFRHGDRVVWDQSLALPDATEVVSGMSIVVHKGVNVAAERTGGSGSMEHDGYYYEPCPRACLATSDDGTVAFMVIVDGKPGNAGGVRFPRLGDFFTKRLGVDEAFNLDGGGSAMLWTKQFGLVSKPSYGAIREVIFSTFVV